MKTKNYVVFALMASALFLASCKKDAPGNQDKPGNNPGQTVNIDVKDLVAPANFNFSAEKDLNVRVKVANPTVGYNYVIKIYSNVPSTGELISTGVMDASSEYSTNVRVPSYQEHIWIEKINPDGSSEYEKVKASLFISSLFTSGTPDPFIFRKSSGMTCNTGCSGTQNNHSGYISVASGQTMCFTGTISGSTINVENGGTIKVCASGSIGSITINGNAKVYILENTTLTLNGLNIYSSNGVFKNWSDSLIVNASLGLTGNLENHGKMYINGGLNLYNSGTIFDNYGTLNVNGNFANSDNFKNYHYTTVTGNLDVYSGAKVYDYCYLKVNGNAANSGEITIGGLMKVLGTYNPYSGSSTKLDNGSLLSVQNMTLSGTIEATGTNRSVVKVKSNTTMYSGSILKSKIDLCDSNGVETNQTTLQGGAAIACTGYIATSTCNPEGFGVPAIQDADSDGIADAQDAYPNDATRAFNSYYPSATTCASIAFEDLWPATGDFDYNDMTIAFNIQKVLNAQNKVVDYKVKLKVRSVGASFDNGFGFRLDEVLPSAVSTVTGQSITKTLVTLSGNKTEANQDRAVIICFDSPEPTLQRASGSMFNTIKANPAGTSDTLYVNVAFGTPVEDAKLSIDKFNPFIITNQRRGYEVHLGNFKPTSLATTSLFGTEQDRSEPSNNKYYKTANNLPWAILIPERFDYPVEKTPITTAYNFFDDWAVSGGTTITNWYQDLSQHRNAQSIY